MRICVVDTFSRKILENRRIEIQLFEQEPDHIVPIQHGGKKDADNFALACLRCNRRKGPNVGSFDPETGVLVPFYHLRNQVWVDHFRLDGSIIQPLTPEGRVTVKILQLNEDQRVKERPRLMALE